MSELYREKSLERVNSPEELSDYIRVATPSVWLVLLGILILLVGILAWSVLGSVVIENADGSTTTIHHIMLVTN